MSLHASSGFLGGQVAGPISGTGATVAASAPVLDMSQTWNNVAVTFTGWKLNVTDSASASSSLLVDLEVGGVSKFKVTKGGMATFGPGMIVDGANNRIDGNSDAALLRFGVSFDVGISRLAAGVWAFGNGSASDTSATIVAKNLKSVGSTFANLTAAATAGAGARAWVTDATQTFASANFGAAVTGGGANGVPVVSNGTSWLIG